jgi:hypothetical protein
MYISNWNDAASSTSAKLVSSSMLCNPSSLVSTVKMGNDGGSIPDRRDLVKNKPKVNILLRHTHYVSTELVDRPSKRTRPIKRRRDGVSVHSPR